MQEVAGLLAFEDLREVVLVGHSYAGLVIAGAAARAPDRVARLVYFDAFVAGERLTLQPLARGDRVGS